MVCGGGGVNGRAVVVDVVKCGDISIVVYYNKLLPGISGGDVYSCDWCGIV